MDGKRDDTRKGPWKIEEDEVLINHVKKYGPRDWSSIRSKGLLQRTGKSCRLRWVNKLRPNLKNGCKFTAEEERVVIELQGQFGNKWARIATYLPGRTDNDVKNFWSSRQKRLARILHNSSSDSKSRKIQRTVNVNVNVNVPQETTRSEVTNMASLGEEETSHSTMFPHQPIKMDPFPQLISPDMFSVVDPMGQLIQTETNICGGGGGDCDNGSLSQIPFSYIPQSQPINTELSPDSQELIARLDDPYLFDLLGPDVPDFGKQMFFEPTENCCSSSGMKDEPDVFFDDFPADMFDQMEFPSPPD